MLVLLAGNKAMANEQAKLAAKGKALFVVCQACHTTTDRASIKIGPSLQGIVGRDAGSLTTFSYSTALSEAAFSWDEASLDKWLQSPATLVPGNIMSFAGLSDEGQRKAIIAYLKTL
ncbi:cytochrome c [Alteromonas lipolytica]|nr:cytochrome c [Alteromonas lipolytica]